MDTEILYNKNLKEQYNRLLTNGWINSHFKYTFNSHGFRCDEFTEDPTIMFVGCSNTMGIGLPRESVWPTLVSAQLNMRCANLGIGGGSSDTAFRLTHGWIDRIKPKMVIFLEPPGFRLELVSDDRLTQILINTYNVEFASYIKEWNMSHQNTYFNSQKNQLAIKSLCDARNIQYFYFQSNQLSSLVVDSARDLAHCGPKTHKLFADYVVSKIT